LSDDSFKETDETYSEYICIFELVKMISHGQDSPTKKESNFQNKRF
jgi:hypothetical protein